MAVREIVTLGNKILKRKAQQVDDFGPELQTLIDDMIETMRAAPGVGLAGPQVNTSLRVIVVEFGDAEDEEVPKKLYSVVNPEISRSSTETILAAEGCLSIPGLLGDVERSESVTVVGKNRRGQPVKIKATGWLARIFQHEVDHVNGILFLDRAEKIYEPVEEDVPEQEEEA